MGKMHQRCLFVLRVRLLPILMYCGMNSGRGVYESTVFQIICNIVSCNLTKHQFGPPIDLSLPVSGLSVRSEILRHNPEGFRQNIHWRMARQQAVDEYLEEELLCQLDPKPADFLTLTARWNSCPWVSHLWNYRIQKSNRLRLTGYSPAALNNGASTSIHCGTKGCRC